MANHAVNVPDFSQSDPDHIPHGRHALTVSALQGLDVGHSDPEILHLRGHSRPSRRYDAQSDMYSTPPKQTDPPTHPPTPCDDPSSPSYAQNMADLPFSPAQRRSIRGSLSMGGHNAPSPTPARPRYSRPPVKDDDYSEDFHPSSDLGQQEEEEEGEEEEVDELEGDSEDEEEEDLAMPSHDDPERYHSAVFGEDNVESPYCSEDDENENILPPSLSYAYGSQACKYNYPPRRPPPIETRSTLLSQYPQGSYRVPPPPPPMPEGHTWTQDNKVISPDSPNVERIPPLTLENSDDELQYPDFSDEEEYERQYSQSLPDASFS